MGYTNTPIGKSLKLWQAGAVLAGILAVWLIVAAGFVLVLQALQRLA